ncbi:MAG TPA: energy transducer TonB [Bacteroidia bacterium]|nr:energy transducer TonB [Bacteroidia bacterium]
MKFFRVLPFLFLLPACLSDEQQADIAAADSALKAEQTVDTFVVGKRSEIISTPEGESLRLENDTAIENMRLAISGNAGSEDEVITNSPVVRNPDVGPSFPGGSVAMDKFIAKNLIYPNIAYVNDITGTVNVRFVVETDGRITGIVAQNKIGYGCDESAVDLIKSMPTWVPGKKGGVNVRCSVVLPVTFGRKETPGY